MVLTFSAKRTSEMSPEEKREYDAILQRGKWYDLLPGRKYFVPLEEDVERFYAILEKYGLERVRESFK